MTISDVSLLTGLALLAVWSMALHQSMYALFSSKMRRLVRFSLLPSWLSLLFAVMGVASLWGMSISLLADSGSDSLSDPLALIALALAQSVIVCQFMWFAFVPGSDHNHHLFGLTVSERIRLAVIGGLLLIAPWLIRAVMAGLHEPTPVYFQWLSGVFLVDSVVFLIVTYLVGKRRHEYSALYQVHQPVSNGR